MSKAKEVKKEDRKKPTKSLKEKRLAKQEKKKSKSLLKVDEKTAPWLMFFSQLLCLFLKHYYFNVEC